MTENMRNDALENLMPPRDGLGLLVVDLQDGFFKIFDKKVADQVVRNSEKIIALFRRKNFPVAVSEHYPKGLGPTNARIAETLSDDYDPFLKTHFSCFMENGFSERFAAMNRRHIVLIGVETQICVLQTCYDLISAGNRVYVPVDAVGSRTKVDWQYGLKTMKKMGAALMTTEMLIFWLLEKAGTEDFKFMLPYLK